MSGVKFTAPKAETIGEAFARAVAALRKRETIAAVAERIRGVAHILVGNQPPAIEEEPEPEKCRVCDATVAETTEGLCQACMAERDAHPVWQAIQRVEAGAVTVTRTGDLDPGAFALYELATSDGWIIEVFSDGVPFRDWDYIESATGPDGTHWETYTRGVDRRPPAHPMPSSVWLYRPWPPHEKAWALGYGK